MKTYQDEFRDREMCEFDWGDLREQLIRGLDRDLICHLGKTGEADRAIQYSATLESYEEGLDYYYEKHHKEWEAQHVVTE